jgi:2-polyprenyl-3-methyl-5-hydroxy-6-metoxy-1,4-benzoquinol methylase
MTETKKLFPDWNSLYRNEKVADMPWYNENLDFDLEEEIIKRKITSGKFLDLGTGQGTQAVQLSRLGFYVTGSDLLEHAIENTTKLSDKVNFIVDNILSSQIKGNEFDYI